MKRERLTSKQKIQKKIELRHKNLVFINTKGQKKMDEGDMLRIYGKVLSVPIVKPVTDETIKVNQIFSLARPVPKRIFFYWGGSDLSWMRYMTLYSFRKMNPDWEMVLYVSDNVVNKKTWIGHVNQDYFQYSGSNYFSKLKDLNIKIEKVEFPLEIRERLKNVSSIQEGDLFRYYQLYVGGGFYCDMDVLFFRPIDNFYNKIIDGGYDTIIHEYESSHDWTVTIGFLGASTGNDFYKNLFEFGINDYINDTNNLNDYQSMGNQLIYKMFLGVKNKCKIFNEFVSKYPYLRFYNLSTSLIYKFDWTQIDYCFKNEIEIKDFDYNSIGYHWYGGGEASQKYNNILTEKNYKDHKNTFSSIAEKVISMKADKNGRISIEEMPKPKVSIIMTSYNRAELLNLGLSSIAKQKIDYSFEIVVVNDGADDNTKDVCDLYGDKLNINYIFSGQRNANGMIYRSSSIPINIGIKNAKGDIIILSCAEIYHLNDGIGKIIKPLLENHNYITIPESMYFDNIGNYTKDLLEKKSSNKLSTCEPNITYTEMPFLMGIWSDHIFDIHGYDEDLIGYAAEDNDFVDRLLLKGCKHHKVDAKIIHLYHGKRCSGVEDWNNPKWAYNYKIYKERKGILIRNVDREWGVI